MPSDVRHYPFQIVGIDLFHRNGQGFVLVVDYYSRYWEIGKLYKADAATIIKKIKNVFSRIGIPEIVTIENGPQYNSRKSKKFAKDSKNSKKLLEKAKQDNKDPYLAMLEERNTPIDNYKSPANFACGRQLQSILPVSSNNLTVKPVENDEFMQKRWEMKSK